MSVVETVVGRQPIFDRDLTVRGYEIVFRPLVPPAAAADGEGPLLTPEALLGSASDGIDALVGAKRAFCHAPRPVVTGEVPITVAADRVVVEIGQAMMAGETDLAGCRRLIDDGYTLAVDGFHRSDGADDLLKLASIVKIDTEAVGGDELVELVGGCRRFPVEIVAENVHTAASLGRCEALGFDYFQGHLLARPHVAAGGPPAPGRLAGLRVSARLLDGECPIGDIEDLIRADPAMSHQLLRLAGVGAAGGMRRTVRTLRQALVLVGWRRLQSWVALLLLTDDGATSEEEVALALMRARMTELLAPAAGCRPDGGYTAGLLSALDVVLGIPVAKILEALPLDAELRDAVMSAEGPLGLLLADVADYQLGRPEQSTRSALPEHALRAAAVEALTWTVGMTAALDSGELA